MTRRYAKDEFDQQNKVVFLEFFDDSALNTRDVCFFNKFVKFKR